MFRFQHHKSEDCLHSVTLSANKTELVRHYAAYIQICLKQRNPAPSWEGNPSSRKTKRPFGMPQYLFLSNISVNLMQGVYLEPIMHCAPLLDAWINRINIADGFVRNYIIQGSDCHMHNRWLAGQHYTVLVSRGLWTQITTDGGLWWSHIVFTLQWSHMRVGASEMPGNLTVYWTDYSC